MKKIFFAAGTAADSPKKVLEGVSGMLEVFPGMIYQKHKILYYLI